MSTKYFSGKFQDGPSETARHNLGRCGPKYKILTALAYCSGINSSVALLLSSREQKVQWDLVLVKASGMPQYLDFSKRDKDISDEANQFMC